MLDINIQDPIITQIEEYGYPLSYINRHRDMEEDQYSGDDEWDRGMEEADRRWSERFDR